MRFSSNINNSFGNQLCLLLPLDMRVRVRELDECCRMSYNGSLCIHTYKNSNYSYIKDITVAEGYYTIEDIREFIKNYYPDFADKIELRIDSKTLKMRSDEEVLILKEIKKDEEISVTQESKDIQTISIKENTL